MFVSQSSNLAEEVVSLQNRIAELEDEKGNLQLRLVEMDDALTAQGDTSQLSLYLLFTSSLTRFPHTFPPFIVFEMVVSFVVWKEIENVSKTTKHIKYTNMIN